MMPQVSIIVTAFNQSDTLRQTLDSILAQKCNFPFEIIIGDDCSTDGTRNLCIEYQNRHPEIIRSLLHSENVGVGANFALCVKQAKGKYIALCAADDFWHNHFKLKLQVEFLEKNNDCGLLYTEYNRMNSKTEKTNKNHLKTSHKKIYEGANLFNTIFSKTVPILTLTVMFRKALFDRYVPANDYIRLRFPLEDWPTWLILSKYTKIGYLPVSTATYRYGHDSISNMLSYQKIETRFAKEKTMIQFLCDMFPEELRFHEPYHNNKLNSVLLNLAYKKLDYVNANVYARKLSEYGVKNLQVIMAYNWFTFKLFSILKCFRFKIDNH